MDNPLENIINGSVANEYMGIYKDLIERLSASPGSRHRFVYNLQYNIYESDIYGSVYATVWENLCRCDLSIQPVLLNDELLVYDVYTPLSSYNFIRKAQDLRQRIDNHYRSEVYLIPLFFASRRYWSGDGIFISASEVVKLTGNGYVLHEHWHPVYPTAAYILRKSPIETHEREISSTILGEAVDERA